VKQILAFNSGVIMRNQANPNIAISRVATEEFFTLLFVAMLASTTVLAGERPQMVATWLGGEGSWHDPANWSGGVAPNNTELATYAVEILTADARVTTDPEADDLRIDRLTVGAGAEVMINVSDLNIEQAGILMNDGLIEFSETAGGINFRNDVEIQGSGVLRTNFSSSIDIRDAQLINGVNHTLNINGELRNDSGNILSQFINRGTLNTEGLIALIPVINDGVIQINENEELGSYIEFIAETQNNGIIKLIDNTNLYSRENFIVGGELNLMGQNIGLAGKFKDITFTGNALSTSNEVVVLSGTCVNNATLKYDGIEGLFYYEPDLVLNGSGSMINIYTEIYGNWTHGEEHTIQNLLCYKTLGVEKEAKLINNGNIINFMSGNAEIDNLRIIENIDIDLVPSGVINNEFGVIKLNGIKNSVSLNITAGIIGGNLQLQGNINSIDGILNNVEITGNPVIENALLKIDNNLINNSEITFNTCDLMTLNNEAFLEGMGNLNILGTVNISGTQDNEFIGTLVNKNNHTLKIKGDEASNIYKIVNNGNLIFLEDGRVFNNFLENSGEITIENEYDYNIENYIQMTGNTVLRDAFFGANHILFQENNQITLNGGALKGQGVLRNALINNGGAVSPGFEGETGIFFFQNSSFAQAIDGALNIDILLKPDGLHVDQLLKSPQADEQILAMLGGTLNIYVDSKIDVIEPVVLKILEFDEISGSFDQINIFDESPFVDIEINQDNQIVSIQVILTPVFSVPGNAWVTR
jgi:hypothetical protein